jgi:hypothetical protein
MTLALYNRPWWTWGVWLKFGCQVGWRAMTSDTGFVCTSADRWHKGYTVMWGVESQNSVQRRWRLEYFKQHMLDFLEKEAAKYAG